MNYHFININASRIPAAQPEGSLFAVSGFLSFCVRKFEEKEADEEEEANNKKRSAGCAGGGLKRSAGYSPTNPTVLQSTRGVLQTLQSFNPREGSYKPCSPSIHERGPTNLTVLQFAKRSVQTLQSFNARDIRDNRRFMKNEEVRRHVQRFQENAFKLDFETSNFVETFIDF